MNFKEFLKENLVFLDGGMGTMLQSYGIASGEKSETWNITHPDIIKDIHLSYLNAGSNIITINTFGANRLKFDNTEEIISSAIANARNAIAEFDGDKERCFVALDMGPLGKMLEPLGDMKFEDAVDIFKETSIYLTNPVFPFPS